MAPIARIAIAANFTAEPLERPLHYWMHKLQINASVAFAPYNQVFQQLLDHNSLFNSRVADQREKKIDFILIRLEEWLGRKSTPHNMGDGAQVTPPRLQAIPPHLKRHLLPNGLEITHQNPYETDYLV